MQLGDFIEEYADLIVGGSFMYRKDSSSISNAPRHTIDVSNITVKSRYIESARSAHFRSLYQDFSLYRDFLTLKMNFVSATAI